MIKTIFFDLDGTLLPMDQDVFTNAYFRALAAKAAPLGYEPKALVDGVWAGTKAMVKNDGSKTNEQAFWDTFLGVFGQEHAADIAVFNDFYENEFNTARDACGFDPRAGELVHDLKLLGYSLVLASNPIFPLVAQKARMRWAGVEPNDFRHITSYENSRYCKPNPAYFRALLEELELKGEECLMIGNDAGEDTPAAAVGIRVFLLTNCLINNVGFNLSSVPHGDFTDLRAFFATLR
ncbi:MAG: HAD family hydrolase [Oscillibacter sp.]|nr:HAD family hydrolase [Oscillibacter sp.]